MSGMQCLEMEERCMTDVRKDAQDQAEQSYSDFMRWCKISTYTIIAAFLILASCNFGVDDKKYPNYNGEVYAPKNLGETK